MAVIGSIRKRSGLLIIMIGVALVLFLLGDLFSGGASFFNRQEIVIGTIAGDEIKQQEFEIKVEETIAAQYGPEGASEQVRRSIRERVWRDMVNERVLNKEYQKLGISVSPNELLEQVKNTKPGDILYQQFTDPNTGQIVEQFRDPQTGGLNTQRLLQTIDNILKSEQAADWLPIENAIKEDVAKNKYTTMIGKGLFMNDTEAQRRFEEKNTTYSFSFVIKEFMSIPDDQIEVTDEDYKNYYNAHKDDAMFQSPDETRSAKFVQFMMQPTSQDLREIQSELEEVKAAFVADTNDTAFVAENAESRWENLIKYYKPETLPIQIRDTVQNSEVGAVFGPYQNGAFMVISKLSQINMSPDTVEASHILLRVEQGDTAGISAAKARLDSIKAVAQANKNFADLAKEFSDDVASGAKGGELGRFPRGQMVPSFEKACFEGEVGDMSIVTSQFGVHLIYITDQTEDKPRYLLSSVDLAIEPSDYTADSIYTVASKFAVNHRSLEKFEASTEFPVMAAEGIRMDDPTAGAMGGETKEIVRWMYEDGRELGDVSEPFELEDKILIVALSNIREEGLIPMENAKPLMRPEIMKEKKAQQFIDAYGSYTSLEEAGQNGGADIQRVPSARFTDNSLAQGVGREPKILGTISAMESGKVSKPIVGNRGVFVVRLDGKNAAQNEPDLQQERSMMNNNYATRAERRSIEALQEAFGVEDNRGKYY